jgi:hypothetical protein
MQLNTIAVKTLSDGIGNKYSSFAMNLDKSKTLSDNELFQITEKCDKSATGFQSTCNAITSEIESSINVLNSINADRLLSNEGKAEGRQAELRKLFAKFDKIISEPVKNISSYLNSLSASFKIPFSTNESDIPDIREIREYFRNLSEGEQFDVFKSYVNDSIVLSALLQVHPLLNPVKSEAIKTAMLDFALQIHNKLKFAEYQSVEILLKSYSELKVRFTQMLTDAGYYSKDDKLSAERERQRIEMDKIFSYQQMKTKIINEYRRKHGEARQTA